MVPTSRRGAEYTMLLMLLINNENTALFQGNSESLQNGSGRAHGWTKMADGSIGGRLPKKEQHFQPDGTFYRES